MSRFVKLLFAEGRTKSIRGSTTVFKDSRNLPKNDFSPLLLEKLFASSPLRQICYNTEPVLPRRKLGPNQTVSFSQKFPRHQKDPQLQKLT